MILLIMALSGLTLNVQADKLSKKAMMYIIVLMNFKSKLSSFLWSSESDDQ